MTGSYSPKLFCVIVHERAFVIILSSDSDKHIEIYINTHTVSSSHARAEHTARAKSARAYIGFHEKLCNAQEQTMIHHNPYRGGLKTCH